MPKEETENLSISPRTSLTSDCLWCLPHHNCRPQEAFLPHFCTTYTLQFCLPWPQSNFDSRNHNYNPYLSNTLKHLLSSLPGWLQDSVSFEWAPYNLMWQEANLTANVTVYSQLHCKQAALKAALVGFCTLEDDFFFFAIILSPPP